MKKRIIVFAVLVIIVNFTGCNKVSEENRLAIATWEKVVNKEFSNGDVWAGNGLYFYEEDNEKYCVYMIYGSGVPVAYHYESKVVVTEGRIKISLPINRAEGTLNGNLDNNEMKEYILIIEDDMVMMGDKKFTLSDELKNRNKLTT